MCRIWAKSFLVAVLLGWLGTGCAAVDPDSATDPDSAIEDDADDIAGPFSDRAEDAFGIVERSPEAESILRLVNEASVEELTASRGVRLSRRVAINIVDRRVGPDLAEGTVDDLPFYSLEALDAVPYVGKAVFTRLATYVRETPIPDTACSATTERPFPLELVVTPMADGASRIVQLIDAAERSIDVTIYQFNSSAIREALEAASRRGVRVRVILDRSRRENEGLMQRLIAQGIEAQLSSQAFIYTHQKTITFDEETTFVFSGNLETNSFSHSRNFGVIDRDFEDVRDFDALFEADWTSDPPNLDCTRLVYSPINSRSRIVELLLRASHTIDIEAMYITDEEIGDALLTAHSRGVAVRVLLNNPDFGLSGSTAVVNGLIAAGIEVRKLPTLFIHAKVSLVDGEWFFVGSENFSRNSLNRNREAGVVLAADDVDMESVRNVFETDWANAVPF
jgi:phosphatidylserine/phosphatidylglycerophosphate/cardiolipin synthase-like enzyme